MSSSSAGVTALVAEILADAVGEEEQWWAFRQRFVDGVRYPLHGFMLGMLGEPILVTGVHYDGNSRRGIWATCRKLNDESYVVALADLELLEGSDAARYLAAYRKWLGIELARNCQNTRAKLRQGKAVEGCGLALHCQDDQGSMGFWSIVDRLTATDLGARCNAEWDRRLVKIEGCWRMQGVTTTWSKPCVRPGNE